jgi:bile salt-stimulated lipase
MVFLHGGAFVDGSGESWSYGPNFLVQEDVIIVTLNYRLGVLGFLSTGTGAAQGNYGLKDQVLALKWVQNNIARFGGNPNEVTIFGQSAGAVSVNYQIISDMRTPNVRETIEI